MRCAEALLGLILFSSLLVAQDRSEGPTSEKAQKSYKQALDYVQERKDEWALDEFKKADKQDGGHCLACERQMIHYGSELGDGKAAELGAEEMLAAAGGEQEVALAHYQLARVFLAEGLQKQKGDLFARSHEEASEALSAYANFPDALLVDGKALAHLGKDDEAKDRFTRYLQLYTADDLKRRRAKRYLQRPELARARMAPPFAVTTLDGQHISLDDLHGKVVLLDFWATWCGPCREALPHIRELAKEFQGEPLVILSVSLDSDERTWKEFVHKKEMTWPQCREGGFSGSLAKLFGVTAIPHTFTIDTDGVLQEEHIGDASIEGKLKKLISRARELQPKRYPGSSRTGPRASAVEADCPPTQTAEPRPPRLHSRFTPFRTQPAVQSARAMKLLVLPSAGCLLIG